MPDEKIQLLNSEEKRKFSEKIESIFVSRTQNARLALYPSATSLGARFVHYTTAEAALSIIKSKRIWMRNAMLMADYKELHHGFNILSQFFNNPAKGKHLIEAIDLYAVGAAAEALDLFNSWWGQIQVNTFVASISEHSSKEDLHGRLSMWRAFGSHPARVAIVFNLPSSSPAAEKLNFHFNPVVYLSETDRQDLIPEIIENIKREKEFFSTLTRQQIVNSLFYMLRTNVTCLKHGGFNEEKEWRVVHCPQLDGQSKSITPTTQIVGGVPQRIYELALDGLSDPDLFHIDLAQTLDRLIIGPSPYPYAMSGAFIEALTSIKVKDAETKIYYSGIPIRS